MVRSLLGKFCNTNKTEKIKKRTVATSLKPRENGLVFSCCLNDWDLRTVFGRLFHTCGCAKARAWCPLSNGVLLE